MKTVPELVDYLKKNPGKLNYGSSGIGIPKHAAAELFQIAPEAPRDLWYRDYDQLAKVVKEADIKVQ